jgi:hypothetical protein
MTTCWPNNSPMRGATMRASTSLPPPAANVTTMAATARIVRAAQVPVTADIERDTALHQPPSRHTLPR